MRRLIPDTIAARAMLVLVLGLTVSHVLSVELYVTDRTSALLFTGGEHAGERIAVIDRIFQGAPATERRRIIKVADGPAFHVLWSQESAVKSESEPTWQAGVLRAALTSHFGGEGARSFLIRYVPKDPGRVWNTHLKDVHHEEPRGETLLVSLKQPDGGWLNFAVPIESPEPFWSLRFGLSMVVMLMAVGLLSALVVYHLTRPIATFAKAAERLGADVKAPPIPVRGPAEVRQAISAFNEMQRRIQKYIQDRTQMLAAISHDLGTPITRMRLRAEFVDDEAQRSKMLSDLDDMEKMVFSILSFARDEIACEPHTNIDLKTLLQRVCNDMSDAGHSVQLSIGAQPMPYACRPTALRRALTNLIDNAIKYGDEVFVSLRHDEREYMLWIDDKGPGIPDDLIDEAFKPFRRLEPSRSRETGGTGLGLTVARTIIQAHGGDLTLSNRPGGGLRATVTLPR